MFYFPATENPAELRPKNTLGGQQNESMFLLRYVNSGRAARSPCDMKVKYSYSTCRPAGRPCYSEIKDRNRNAKRQF